MQKRCTPITFAFRWLVVASFLLGIGTGITLANEQPNAPLLYQPCVQPAYIILTVITDKPVTITPTLTVTMQPYERTVQASFTKTSTIVPGILPNH